MRTISMRARMTLATMAVAALLTLVPGRSAYAEGVAGRGSAHLSSRVAAASGAADCSVAAMIAQTGQEYVSSDDIDWGAVAAATAACQAGQAIGALGSGLQTIGQSVWGSIASWM